MVECRKVSASAQLVNSLGGVLMVHNGACISFHEALITRVVKGYRRLISQRRGFVSALDSDPAEMRYRDALMDFLLDRL